ncbi:hypothetical protein D9613_003092 [Agrocybe pediades]|uniref:tRNA (guanine(26)-N(2))-dimethyltransferase n=1 Tax=Agrocybe pediades TaxID=84607 RepID=A0A8H4QQQ3_9AGAR|nr:hypothetical protein D9613_003092 [Agrocybe pediades]
MFSRSKGAKSALIARLEEYEKNHVASPSPGGIRQVSSTASPAEPPASAEVPGNPEQSSSSVSVPFWDIKMPDLSQPEPVEPIRIPFVPDFWDSSALAQPSGPNEETLPKIVVVAGANTHRGGGPSHNFVDASEGGHQEQNSSTQATTASSRSGSLLDDIAEDLGLPPDPSKDLIPAFDGPKRVTVRLPVKITIHRLELALRLFRSHLARTVFISPAYTRRMSSTAADSIEIPAGFRLHTENTSHILLSENEAFLNPVQEFNRDLSVACIRVWSEELNRAKEQRWNKAQANKLKRAAKPTAEKNVESMAVDVGESSATAKENGSASSSVKTSTGYRPYKFVILEALSATGLRSIRYAKEIPLVKYVIANDLSAGAVEAMKRNISINGFEEFDASSAASKGANPKQMVHINEGDACHREEKNQVDVVDLDPYGTAAPFIDAAIQCVNNGGLLCVTCTDLSVLATTNYPEKCKNSTFYICSTCQTHYEQPLGRVITKTSANGNNNYIFKTQAGPLIPSKCPECESTLHVAGPMWSGPLHNNDFVGKVLTHVGENEKNYNTSGRMKGMLTVAKEELENPFYFTPSKVASFFHCETPSLDDVASALLNAGHKVSRSHACAGSLKTDASHRQLHDIYRSWIKLHPVKLDNISETSPARRLLSKESMTEADFKRHPQTIGALETIRLVRYQENPAGWGPGKKASAKVDLKRKRSSEVLEEPPAKH